MPRTLFTNVSVFDGSGQSSFPGEVLVQGNRIRTVAKGNDQIDSSLAEEVVDGGGATLMPGLTEAHGAPLLYQLRSAQGHRQRAS
jgi:N-acyl-D-aspartate/D-glutamate deacylase